MQELLWTMPPLWGQHSRPCCMVCILGFDSCHALSRFEVGFSLLMFIGTIWVLTREDRRHYNWTMIAVAVILLVLSTVVSSFVDVLDFIVFLTILVSVKHMIVDIVRTQEGLVKYRDTFLGGPVAFFGDVAQNTYVIKSALYTLQTLVGDGVVVCHDSQSNVIR